MKFLWQLSFFFVCISLLHVDKFSPLHASEDLYEGENHLMRDLLIVDYWNHKLNERLPVTYNHLLYGGYFNMPSARMGLEGEIGVGYSSVAPYRNYNIRFQLLEHLELSTNYRIFNGIQDPVFGHLGFGEFSDKGANAKISLFNAEDSRYELPSLAIGFEDFLGTRAFRAYYIVFSHVFLKYNTELSLGYGLHRIRGLFGGMAYFPFRKSDYSYLKELSFALEYDATPYKDVNIEPHPRGRSKRSPFNIGVKYRLWDNLDFSLAYVRGKKVAFSISTYFNFGATQGILPKIEDMLVYQAPINIQELGFFRPEDVLIQDLNYAFLQQGFDLTEAWISDKDCQKTLRLQVSNGIYRTEEDVRERLNYLLSALIPTNIDWVVVVIEAIALPVQEYHYKTEHLQRFREHLIGSYELRILSPLCEVSSINPYTSKLLFKKNKEAWNMEILPKTYTLFGSSRGKFKYGLGLSVAFNGFLYGNIYYSISLGYFFFSNLHDINDIDRLNPSQIINVRTDIINYYKQKTITVDEAFMQKIWNIGKGWYARTSLGLFEVEYGGVSSEFLYYPVGSAWAVGIEGSILRKRALTGVGFTDTVRKLHGFEPSYLKFLGSQFFVNAYYDWKDAAIALRVSTGKFLANDYGARFEMTKYYPSGMRVSFWYTHTNADDIINGERYHDKGVYFSMPLDIFYTRSSRSRWGYGMSAWLRDVGIRIFTGTELYYFINDQRQ